MRTKYEKKAITTEGAICHIRQRTITEIVTFIENNLKSYTISQLCSTLKFPRSTYYKALVCVPSNRLKEYKEFSKQVKQAFEESNLIVPIGLI